MNSSSADLLRERVFDFVQRRYSFSASKGPTREQALKRMARMGFCVVPWGRVSLEGFEALGLDLEQRVVVYTSEYGGHVGADKERMSAAQALEQHPGRLFSRYLETHATSFRLLRAGYRTILVRTRSSDEWRSNWGGRLEFAHLQGPTGFLRGVDDSLELREPLWAVDLLPFEGQLYAVDYNICPGLRWVGAESNLENGNLVDTLLEWFERNEGYVDNWE